MAKAAPFADLAKCNKISTFRRARRHHLHRVSTPVSVVRPPVSLKIPAKKSAPLAVGHAKRLVVFSDIFEDTTPHHPVDRSDSVPRSGRPLSRLLLPLDRQERRIRRSRSPLPRPGKEAATTTLLIF